MQSARSIYLALSAGIITLVSVGLSLYHWIVVCGATAATIPSAIRVFALMFAFLSGLLLLFFFARLAGLWADRQTGWKKWTLIFLLVGMVVYFLVLQPFVLTSQ